MHIRRKMKKYSKAAKRFYDSAAWKSCRESYIAIRISIDGGLCEHCKERLGFIVDHIEEIDEVKLNDPYITLNHKNLQYLCNKCHNRKTFDKENRGVRFDEKGNPIFFEKE